MWKRLWEHQIVKPDTLNKTLSHSELNPSMFPNIHRIISILLVTAVTSCTVERSNSTLKFIKNPYRNSMKQDRLVGLMLMYIHRDIPIDYNRVIDMYASLKPRRMLFSNPCQ